MDDKPIVITCDFAAGTEASVTVTAKALADGGIEIIDYKTLEDAVRYGSDMSKTKFIGHKMQLQYIDRFTIFNSFGTATGRIRKPLPYYRQIEMRKRKY